MLSRAVTILQEGSSRHNEKPQINCKLAQIQLQAGDLAAALESAHKALSALTSGAAFHPPLYLALSSFFEKANRLGEALTTLNRGIVRHPEHSGLHLALGRIHTRQKNFDQAEHCYDAALRFHSGKPTHIYLAIANCCRKRGQDQRAIEALNKALTLDPGHKRLNALLSELAINAPSDPIKNSRKS
jgi:tetratricopeptide (TPR) repeat protein